MKFFRVKNWRRYQRDKGKEWIRIETAMISDPKLSLLCPRHRYVWIGILCLAKLHGNKLPFSDDYLGSALGMPEIEVDVEAFEDLGMIEEWGQDSAEEDEPEERAEKEKAPEILPKGFAVDVKEGWNSSVKTSKIRGNLTGGRLDALRARFREHGEEAISQVIENRGTSKFLNEFSNGRGASFDWVFGKDNFQKVLDGNYNDANDALPLWVKRKDELGMDDFDAADECVEARGFKPKDISKAQKIECLYDDVKTAFAEARKRRAEGESVPIKGRSISAVLAWYISAVGKHPGAK